MEKAACRNIIIIIQNVFWIILKKNESGTLSRIVPKFFVLDLEGKGRGGEGDKTNSHL
jgi:hypothetical protein